MGASAAVLDAQETAISMATVTTEPANVEMSQYPVGTSQAMERQATAPIGVTMSFVLVTPGIAAHWLEQYNTHNRPMKPTAIMRYAVDFRAGRWMPSPQGIAFDTDGVLIDGQNRLAAIVKADVAACLMVTRGWPANVQARLDSGIIRTTTDKAQLTGMAASPMHSGVAKRMRLGLAQKSSRYFTGLDELYFLKRHWEAVDFAVQMFPVNKRVRSVTVAPVLAAFARAFYHEDRARLRRAAEVMLTGLPKDADEHGLVRFRDQLITSVNQGRQTRQTSKATASDIYGKMCRVLKAYVKNEPLSPRIFTLPTEAWELPILRGRTATI